MFLAALALGAVTARADFTVNSGANGIGTGNQTATPGSSGTSDYQLVLTGTSPTTFGAGDFMLNDFGGQFTSVTYDASASTANLNDAQTLAPGTYIEVVDWTLLPTATVGTIDEINLRVYGSQQGVPTSASDTDTINVVAAPEPGQVMATGLFLGFGGLAFAARRFMKKQAA